MPVPDPHSFRMPAEWEAHLGTWLAWPHQARTWPGEKLQAVEKVYVQMMAALLPGEKVFLLVPDDAAAEKVHSLLKEKEIKTDNLVCHRVKTRDAWIRDYGPTFVKGPGRKMWCKWRFNAWGEKYRDLVADTGVFTPESGLLPAADCIPADFVLEGGSIEVNGSGTCMVTEQCLLNKNRNPELSKEEIEEKLKSHLGVTKILWLENGIAGDDTDGHIDDTARFGGANTILACLEEDKNDENYENLQRNWERLKASTNEDDLPWDLIALPMPGVVEHDGERLPASYANFYIANQVVLLPVFGTQKDDEAVEILSGCFPERKIVPVNCRDLVAGLGTIHCVTQQEPA